MAQQDHQDLPKQSIILWRGFRGVCPRCGKGRLFTSFMKPSESCPVCHADFSAIHADDGPGWFVMVLTGAIVVPVAISLSIHDVLPEWAVITLLCILSVAIVALLLPRAKGIFIALLWSLMEKKASDAQS